ncbi:BMC domain protein [Clostridium homopropionicum DSM 5847]|uniref:BMC domain protein n=1 Tax=Clostridium homopropionicum DSM 5847 TaxID=1121318 RepID=A0A0L6Z6J9_9CLOT|nr:BMC domain-containing protein [Clostridium homopropionicum]KOA18594.1 BMC domain protein [Clostridium homopropionicum DSM 5847]SFG49373.1 BMC domain-containing protein [Clostridium homopropionicum]
MNKKALGLLEVQGYSVALAVMDKACKSAEIEIKSIDCNNPKAGDKANIPLVVQVKFVGSVSDVKIALEIAKEAALEYIPREDIVTSSIALYDEELEKLLQIGKVNKK